MTPLLWWLAVNAVTVAVMIPFVMLLSRLFWKRPAVQHLLWVIVLLKMVTPPVVSWGMWLPQMAISKAETTAKPILEPRIETSSLELPELPAITEIKRETPSVTLPVVETVEEVQPKNENIVWQPWIVGLWLIGGLLWLARQGRRLRVHARLLRSATPAPEWLTAEVQTVAGRMGVRSPRGVVVAGIASPFVWCVGRPKLVWPAQFTDVESARGVLAHELAHLRRGDHWVSWLELLAGAICWWNPLYYFARRRLREAAEMACDALAVRTAPDHRREYAELLLRMSSDFLAHSPAPVLGVGAGSHASFERRLSMILSDRVSGTVSVRGLLLAGLFAVIVLPGCGFYEAQQQAKEAKEAEKEAQEAANKKDPFAGREDLLPAQKEDPAAPKDKIDKPVPESKPVDPSLPLSKTPIANRVKVGDPLLTDPLASPSSPRVASGAGIDLSILELGDRFLQAEANIKIAKNKLQTAELEAEAEIRAMKQKFQDSGKDFTEADMTLARQKIGIAKIELERAERQMRLITKFIDSSVRNADDKFQDARRELADAERLVDQGVMSKSEARGLVTKAREANAKYRELKELQELTENRIGTKK